MSDPTTPEPTPEPGQTPPPPPAAGTTPYSIPVSGTAPKQSLSLTSFITGLAGLIFAWIPVLGFLSAVAGIVIGLIAKGREPLAPKWMWIVGIIAGALGVLFGLLTIFLIFVLPFILIGNSPGMY